MKKSASTEIWSLRSHLPLQLLAMTVSTGIRPLQLHLVLASTRRRRLPTPLRSVEPSEERGRSPERHWATLRDKGGERKRGEELAATHCLSGVYYA
jgi:hypothetical protein